MSKNLGGQPEPIVKELIKEIDEIDRPKSKSNKGQQQEQKPEKDPNSLEAQRVRTVSP